MGESRRLGPSAPPSAYIIITLRAGQGRARQGKAGQEQKEEDEEAAFSERVRPFFKSSYGLRYIGQHWPGADSDPPTIIAINKV